MLRPLLLAVVAFGALALPASASADHPATGPGENKLVAVHSDNFRTGESEVRYMRKPRPRQTVVDRPRRNFEAARTLASVPAPTSVRTVAVILIGFARDPRRPYTPEQARRIVFTGDDSVSAYLNEASYGQVALSGDVFGWYEIPHVSSGCRFVEWAQSARTAVAAAGFELGRYQHHVFVFPYAESCEWSGMAEMPGSAAWINGALSVRVLGHELGHNLGVHHAGGLRCVEAGARVAIGENCTLDEYGDPFDIMGGGARHTSNWHKAKLGWLSPPKLATVTTSGTFTLAAQEALSADVQLLRVPRGNTGLFYYLELRRPFGRFFDNFALFDPVVKGITVRLAPDYPNLVQSRLIDTTPATVSFGDAPLGVGHTFADPVHGVWIVNRGVLAGKATVEVSLGAAPTAQRPAAARSRARVIGRSHGTARPDRLRGVRLYGRAGDDVLRGISARDLLYGGPGRDRLLGGPGADRLHGGPGRDVLRGGPGSDKLVAGDGSRDAVRCGRGRDVVTADRYDRVGRGCEIVKRS